MLLEIGPAMLETGINEEFKAELVPIKPAEDLNGKEEAKLGALLIEFNKDIEDIELEVTALDDKNIPVGANPGKLAEPAELRELPILETTELGTTDKEAAILED